jgi:hypothetical protein
VRDKTPGQPAIQQKPAAQSHKETFTPSQRLNAESRRLNRWRLTRAREAAWQAEGAKASGQPCCVTSASDASLAGE